MTTLREELEKLANEPWPHGGPRYGRTELAIAAANLALEAAARECDDVIGGYQCAAAIRAMKVG